MQPDPRGAPARESGTAVVAPWARSPRVGPSTGSRGDIRIHADPVSARMARMAGARAFAIGPHVVLDPEACQHERDGGRQVLAHEIAHSVQQRLAGPRMT